MSSNYNVDPAELRNKANTDLPNIMSQLDDIINQLKRHLADIEAVWGGSAFQNYQATIQQVTAAHDQMKDSVENIRTNLLTTADNYDQANTTAQKGFQSM